jgi:hypothetical protein
MPQPLLAHNLKTAEADAGHDGRAPGSLHGADRVAEQRDTDGRAEQRLEVQERPGNVGRDPALTECEQCRRQHSSGDDESGHGEHGRPAVRCARRVPGQQGNRERHDAGSQQLQSADRHRVAPA